MKTNATHITITFQVRCGLEWNSSTAAVWGQTRINPCSAWKPLLPSSSSPLQDSPPDVLPFTVRSKWLEKAETRRPQDFPGHSPTAHTPPARPGQLFACEHSMKHLLPKDAKDAGNKLHLWVTLTKGNYIYIYTHITTGKCFTSCHCSKYSARQEVLWITVQGRKPKKQQQKNSPMSSGQDAAISIISETLLGRCSELLKIQRCKETSRQNS